MSADLFCPVPSCDGRLASRRLLCCARCWRRVPRDLRKDLVASWRLFGLSRSRTAAAQCNRLAADVLCAADIAA